MKCFLKGVGAFVACGLLVALFVPAIRPRGSYDPKKLPIRIKVIDTDAHQPVPAAEVTFFRGREISFDDAEPRMDDFAENSLASAVTDANGFAQVTGTFRAWSSRGPSLFGGHDRGYRLGGGWLRVVAEGRPVAFVSIDGHKFGGDRDYDDTEPLEVVVVMNKLPAP